MNEKDFFDRFTKLLEKEKDRYKLDSVHDALILWFGENYLSLDPSETVERIIEDHHAEGVDAVLIDQTNFELLFIQAKTAKDLDSAMKNLPENDIKQTLEGIRFLLKGDYKGKITPELENLIDEYHELDKTGDYKTKILFLALKRKPINNKFIDHFKKDFPQIEVSFFDFDWFYNYYSDKYLTTKGRPPKKITFEIVSNLLRKDKPHKSLVFTCKGKELAKIYNDYSESIFQQNVRYSLGLRSKSINRQILETAKNGERSENFWYFNNGITIVCNEIRESSNGKIITLKNAQIINGAQTTYALNEAYTNGELNENVELLVKAIQTDDQDFIEKVTLYTNSQNAIKLRDLCSNDEIQVKIQKILSSYGFFMERKRGEFQSLYPTDEAKKRFLGEAWEVKVFSNEDAAQGFLAMFLDKPSQAKNEKGRIFLKENSGFYYSIFNEKDDLLAEKLLMSWKLLQYIKTKIKHYKEEYKSAIKLPAKKKSEIYKYDFLLHSEYFILNLFKDFLINKGYKINEKRKDLLAIVSETNKKISELDKIYEEIKEELYECINEFKNQPEYYHNKFFKSEKSIGLIRSFFNKKYNFVEVIK